MDKVGIGEAMIAGSEEDRWFHTLRPETSDDEEPTIVEASAIRMEEVAAGRNVEVDVAMDSRVGMKEGVAMDSRVGMKEDVAMDNNNPAEEEEPAAMENNKVGEEDADGNRPPLLALSNQKVSSPLKLHLFICKMLSSLFPFTYP